MPSNHFVENMMFAKFKRKKPLEPKDIPQLPWQIVDTVLFMVGKDEYLLVCDNYSGSY